MADKSDGVTEGNMTFYWSDADYQEFFCELKE